MKIRQFLSHPSYLLAFVLLGVMLVGGALATVVTSLTTETWRQDLPNAEIPGLVKRIELDWGSTTAADGVLADIAHPIVGQILGVTFVADSDVSTAYDVELRDEDDSDLLQGQGDDLTTATTSYSFAVPSPVSGVCTLYVDNTTGTGQVVIFVR